MTDSTQYVRPSHQSLWKRIVAQQMLCDRRRSAWPAQMYATDLDSLGDADSLVMIEFYNHREKALVDYKWGRRGIEPRLNTAAIAVQRSFARKAQVPFFVAQYFEDDWSFRWTRLDNLYREPVWHDTDETGWVKLQMELRNLNLPLDWKPAPIHNRPMAFKDIAQQLLVANHDRSTIAAFLTRLEQEYS